MWKILVVDDETVNRKLLKEMLVGKAHCDEVENGKQALEAFEVALRIKNPYDLVLLDIAMPDLDGIEVLKRLRQLEEANGTRFGKGIPVFMVTAYKRPFMESFREGADDYLLKPIDADEMFAKIEAKLGKPSA